MLDVARRVDQTRIGLAAGSQVAASDLSPSSELARCACHTEVEGEIGN